MSLTRFFLFLLCITPTCFVGFFFHTPQPRITIMLDPTGDGQHTGRQLNDGLERGITLQWAQQLQQLVQTHNPGVTVIITRQTGQVVPPLSVAQYANRLPADLYIRLGLYQEQDSTPHIYIYRFSDGTDFVTAPAPFVTYDQAYRMHAGATREYAHLLKNQLDTHTEFICHGTYALRLQPLLGVAVPALMIDAGLRTVQQLPAHTHAVADALQPIIARIRAQKVAS